MAITRYNQRTIFQNSISNIDYLLFLKRGLKSATQFTTAELVYPSPEELEELKRKAG